MYAQIALHIHTLFLFTYSDIKTILVPVVRLHLSLLFSARSRRKWTAKTLFATLGAPKTHFGRLQHTVFWTWIHLLQCCVSNQSISLAEDAVNKPWRPIPACRLSVGHAKVLRWLLLPGCLLVSAWYGVHGAGGVLAVGIWAYNELGLHSHWFTRNVCNAVGYAAFEAGATVVACADSRCTFDPSAKAQLASTLIILTTIHAQDFQDAAGDAVFKRRTIPIVMPAVGRMSMLIFLVFWSVLVSLLWEPGLVPSILLVGLGFAVGYRFVHFTAAGADRRSYLFYSIWLSFAQVITLTQHSGSPSVTFRQEGF